jgi:ferredoxin-thioredoxin reductase catalytic subunit
MNKDLEILRERVTTFCNECGYSLSPEAEVIMGDMVRMKEATGDFYCPCQTQRSRDTVCICTPVRNGLIEVMGTCFCNLIIGKKS